MRGLAIVGAPRPDPWYAPQVLIPLLGIILGNVMNGVSVSLNALRASRARHRYVALKTLQRSAPVSGMIPIINRC
jgi:putative ABC transport system permease protein